MAPAADQTPVPASWVVAPIVYDIIYNPPETLLLRQARKRGRLRHAPASEKGMRD